MKKNLVIISIMLAIIFTACGDSRTASSECNCKCCAVESTTASANTADIAEQKAEVIDVGVKETVQPKSENNKKSEEGKIEYIYEMSAEKKIKEEIYNQAKELYLSGEWDGLPTTLSDHEISFSAGSGHILLDGYIVHQEDLDLPEDFDFESVDYNVQYIPGQGMYAVKDGNLIKYQRREMFIIGKLDCEGLDTVDDDIEPFSYSYEDYIENRFLNRSLPYLYYFEEIDKLILVTTAPTHDKGWLYIFPDYTSSQVQSMGVITNYVVWHSNGEDHFFYTDMDGYEWELTGYGPKRVD